MSYIKTEEYLKRINNRIFESYQAYFIRKCLYFQNETEWEKQKIFWEKYRNFYTQTRDSNLIFFILWITKFFDNPKDNKPLSIRKIQNHIQYNKKEITEKEFLESNLYRPYANDLAERYKWITKKDIKIIDTIIKKHEKIIERFKILRDQWIAHDDTNKSNNEFKIPPYDKIEELFTDIIKITNILSYWLEFSTTDYSHIEKKIQEEVTNIFKNTI